MKSIIFFVLFIFIAGNITGQVEKSGIHTPKNPKYNYDYLNFAGNDKQTRVDMFIQVPFQEVQFIRTANGYEGGYSVTISIYSEDKETLLLEKMWSEKIVSGSFEESSSKDNFNITFRSFQMDPGKYYIKNTIMDKDSRNEYSTGKEFTVKDFSKRPSISDIMLVSKRTVVDSQSKIIPNISGNVSGVLNGTNLYFELYSDSVKEFRIDYKITNKDEEEVYSNSVDQFLNKDLTQIYYTIKDIKLGLGKYNLTLDLLDENGEVIASNSKGFYSRWEGLPSAVDDIDVAIAQVVYIATPEEIEFMESGENEDEKTKRFLDFWKAKDPSPGNEDNEVFDEYYARVSYSNENFSHYIEGWRSDRGLVFITLGAPNNIDRHPFEYDSKPYEVWQYYDLNRSFTFVDYTGFGDYRLITPLYGDLFRYRY
ncbi:GWxTD domain-containing protein [Bacteroidota bacterium]